MVIKVKLPNGQVGNFPDDMSNEEIESVLQKQFPPEAQTNQSETTGLTGILSDVAGSALNAPSSILEAFVNLPGEAIDSAKQAVSHPLRATENLGAGLLEGLKGAYNLPINVVDYLARKKIPYYEEINPNLQKLKIGDTGLEKSILGENEKGDELLRSIGSFVPYAKLGGLSSGLKGATRRAAATSAYAAGQEQDPLTAALMGLAVEGATRGAQSALRPGSLLPSSPLTNEGLKEALDITKGTETSLGNVIENPFLKEQFENVLSKLPLSGANQAMQRTASDITHKGENILNEFKGANDVSDIGTALHKALKSASEETRKTKNAKFTVLNEAADKEGIKTDRTNMIQKANEILEEIKDDPHLESFTDSTAKKILQDIAGEKTGDKYSLKKTDLLRGKIGDRIRDAYQTGNTDLRNILQPLKEAATKDINDAIDNANKPHLKELRNKAFEYYEKEYAPFKEPEIEKFTLRGGDPDLLASAFLKKSTVADRGKLLEKLTSKLTDEQRKLLAYSYFSKAIKDGQLNPLKLKTQYKSLGENQKKALLADDELKKLRDYSELVQKNTRPLDIMFNPKTGYSALNEIPWKSVITSGTAGGYLGGIPGAILGAFAPGIAAKIPVKLLTNPSMRERLINRMIKARENEPVPERNIAPFIQALTEISKQQQS